MATRHRLREEEDDTEINLSPMIDCIFILLIFFIVTTVFVEEKGLKVDKPDAAASVALEEKTNLTFEITADDEVLFEDESIPLAEVTARVQSSLEDPETPVVIRSHAKAAHGTFLAVWDAASLGGAKVLSFNTVN